MCPSGASTGFFALMLQFPGGQFGPQNGAPGVHQDSWAGFAFKTQAPHITRFCRRMSGALDIDPHGFGFGLDPLYPVFHEVADRNDAANLGAIDDRQVPDSALRDERKR